MSCNLPTAFQAPARKPLADAPARARARGKLAEELDAVLFPSIDEPLVSFAPLRLRVGCSLSQGKAFGMGSGPTAFEKCGKLAEAPCPRPWKTSRKEGLRKDVLYAVLFPSIDEPSCFLCAFAPPRWMLSFLST